MNCSSSGKLQVHELDLGHIVSHGEHLLASSGQEYMALDAELTHMTGEEKKMFYQKQFREKLGLSGAAKIDTGNAICMSWVEYLDHESVFIVRFGDVY